MDTAFFVFLLYLFGELCTCWFIYSLNYKDVRTYLPHLLYKFYTSQKLCLSSIMDIGKELTYTFHLSFIWISGVA